MQDLIERLEKAMGPDRRLDTDICDLVFGKQPWYSSSLEWCRLYHAQPTASIDAARTLVPKGMVWGITSEVRAIVDRPHDYWEDNFATSLHEKGSTPAIALCIAALKVRQA